MATQFIATDALGTTHTRRTERTYTHTVVTQYSYEAAVARVHADFANKSYTAMDRKNYEYEVLIATGVDPYPCTTYANGIREVDAPKQALRVAAAAAKIEGGFEGYRARKLAASLARIEADKAAGYYTRFHNLGWCGRLDLAQKLAAKSGGVILAAAPK